MSDLDAMKAKVTHLKRERDILLLAHSYQRPEVQEVADFVGDSLDLSLKAMQSSTRAIEFAGVRFMAETAAVFGKKVLVPKEPNYLGCDLADSITADDVIAWKRKNERGLVVSYVNTSAEVKAVSDYVCTSANCLEVVRALPDVPILLVPDLNLGEYVKLLSGRDIVTWKGTCRVHAGITKDKVLAVSSHFPGAELLIHPESPAARELFGASGVRVASTQGMVGIATSSPSGDFVVATEVGMIDRLRREVPGKNFIPVSEEAVCPFMKLISLEDILASIEGGFYEISLPLGVAERARRAIARTFELLGIEVRA
jgi:quinolinate synthase